MIALVFVAPLVVFLLFGVWCQHHYGTSPWVDGAKVDR